MEIIFWGINFQYWIAEYDKKLSFKLWKLRKLHKISNWNWNERNNKVFE
jgi:hypothetical protein